jgi:tryptophan synthase alpha chain
MLPPSTSLRHVTHRATFEALQAQGRKALIPFVTAGDPSPEVTVPLMHALVAGGADVIELGVPFSDPMADGPTIQRSSERALKHGTTLRTCSASSPSSARRDATTPVVLMGYANPIERWVAERFRPAAADAGVDGVLVVDYPPEEERGCCTLKRARHRHHLLLSPTIGRRAHRMRSALVAAAMSITCR